MQKKQFILLLFGLLCLSVNLYAFQGKKLPGKYKKIQQYLDKATKNKLAGFPSIYKAPNMGNGPPVLDMPIWSIKCLFKKITFFQWQVLERCTMLYPC